MPTKLLLLVLLFARSFVYGQGPSNGEALIKKMYLRYAGKWYQNFTFNQTTKFYKNDSLTGSQIWYEAISFPDHFRIDFGEADSANAVIFKGDSSYFFKKGQLRSTRFNDDDLTFLLGGLYFYPLEQTLKQYRKLGYDLQKFHEDAWMGKPVWVIGAAKDENQLSQLWIDQDHFFLVRMLRFANGRKEEAIFDNHIALEGGWTETKVRFFVNDRLVQEEFYHDCKAHVPIDPDLFDPSSFVKRH